MTARLTDEELTALEHSHGMIESEYTPTCRSVPYGSGCPGATDDSQDFWRRAADAVPAMLAEIKERRAQDLTAEDATWIRAFVEAGKQECVARMGTIPPTARDALAILDRLLQRGGES